MEGKRPPFQREITCTDLGDGIYNFSTPPVGFQQYLILGKEKALLIDSGMGIGSLRAEVEKITSLPLILVNTHGHPDHAGGNAEFTPALMCPREFDVYEAMATLEYRQQDGVPRGEASMALQPTGPAPVPVADGMRIDLGGRSVEVLYTPGHTHGSISLVDSRTMSLFAGDSVMADQISVYEWNAGTVAELYCSLLRMREREPKKIYSGHKPNVLEPELLNREIRCAEQLLSGGVGIPRRVRGGATALAFESEGLCICYDEQKLR